MVSYPDGLYRGLNDRGSVSFDEKLVTASAFSFYEIDGRDDMLECSINWDDDEGALNLIASQLKEGTDTRQFKAGACYIKKQHLDFAIKLPQMEDNFSYERAQLPNNPYHGNLLIRKDTPKRIQKTIIATLATCTDGNMLITRERLDEIANNANG